MSKDTTVIREVAPGVTIFSVYAFSFLYFEKRNRVDKTQDRSSAVSSRLVAARQP